MKKLILFLLTILPLALFSFHLEQGGVRNAALGNSGIASSNDISAVVWNPALLAQNSQISLISDSRKYFWDLVNDDLTFNFLAFSFTYKKIGNFALSGSMFNSERYDEHKLGFHYGNYLLSKKLMVGFSLYNYGVSYGSNEYTANDPLFSEYGKKQAAFDCDFGLAFRPSNKLIFGLAGYNLLEANLALAEDVEDNLTRILGCGTDYTIGSFDLIGELRYCLEESNEYTEYSLGCEFNQSPLLKLRTGLSTDIASLGFGLNIIKKSQSHSFFDPTSSISYINTRILEIGLDYTFQYPISGIESEYGDHFIGLRISYKLSTDELNDLRNMRRPMTQEDFFTKLEMEEIEEPVKEIIKYREKIVKDTIYVDKIVNKILRDTITVIKTVPDTKYTTKVLELELELKAARNNNKAQRHLLEALKFYYINDLDRAIAECNEAIRIAPDLAISYIRLGSIYYKVNDLKNAKLNWRKAYDLDPENPELAPIKEFILSP